MEYATEGKRTTRKDLKRKKLFTKYKKGGSARSLKINNYGDRNKPNRND